MPRPKRRTKFGAFVEQHATQDQCAVEAGVSQSTISKMATGIGVPTSENAAKVLAWCECVAREKKIPRRDWVTLDDLVAAEVVKTDDIDDVHEAAVA